jgi:predicted component of type VI protein secretion system
MHLAPSVRFRVSVVVAALALTGCNSSQELHPSSRTAPEVITGPGYNPYNPISYAQNNTGNRSAGR